MGIDDTPFPLAMLLNHLLLYRADPAVYTIYVSSKLFREELVGQFENEDSSDSYMCPRVECLGVLNTELVSRTLATKMIVANDERLGDDSMDFTRNQQTSQHRHHVESGCSRAIDRFVSNGPNYEEENCENDGKKKSAEKGVMENMDVPVHSVEVERTETEMIQTKGILCDKIQQ
eukprot:scaffold46247_cov199-Amphora_coffeaeformis.AAC.2